MDDGRAIRRYARIPPIHQSPGGKMSTIRVHIRNFNIVVRVLGSVRLACRRDDKIANCKHAPYVSRTMSCKVRFENYSAKERLVIDNLVEATRPRRVKAIPICAPKNPQGSRSACSSTNDSHSISRIAYCRPVSNLITVNKCGSSVGNGLS